MAGRGGQVSGADYCLGGGGEGMKNSRNPSFAPFARPPLSFKAKQRNALTEVAGLKTIGESRGPPGSRPRRRRYCWRLPTIPLPTIPTIKYPKPTSRERDFADRPAPSPPHTRGTAAASRSWPPRPPPPTRMRMTRPPAAPLQRIRRVRAKRSANDRGF